jgi:hypothetical protein
MGSHLNMMHLGPTQILQVRAEEFGEEMFSAADEWDKAVATNAAVQAEKAKLLVIYTAATGFTITAGKMKIQFGGP